MNSVTFTKKLAKQGTQEGKRRLTIILPQSVAERVDPTIPYQITLVAVDTVSVARKETQSLNRRGVG